ncbi:MAG: M20/M25/M40 family metallo-hydrolase [Tissierellia bacterium]|nr:M20/M25/M40 family metallo-hydrolase [Tissierellia bacterium]
MNIKKLKELVAIESITNSEKEVLAEEWYVNELRSHPYFKQYPNQMGWDIIPGDVLKRGVVWGLYLSEPRSQDTVVFINHHDVVSVEEYGQDREFAFDPDMLQKIFPKRSLPQDAKVDLESGQWLFGRGVADMKGGGVTQLGVLDEVIEEELPMNILFLTVPDEENLSLGMRYGRILMDKIEKEFDLHYILCIDGEPYMDWVENKVTYYDSSAGKVMLNVYVQGKKSHIGEVLTGLNPLAILGRLMARTEWDTSLCDRTEHVVAPPPTWSIAGDFKERYDASIPQSAGGLYCQVTVSKTAMEILDEFKIMAQEVLQESLKIYREATRNFYGTEANTSMEILTFKEIWAMAKEKDREEAKIVIEDLKKKYRKSLDQGDLSIPEFNFYIIQGLLEYLDIDEPCMVLAISPPYYPYAPNELEDSWKRILEESGKEVYGQEMYNAHYFMGISDLSYLSTKETKEEIREISENIPMWNEDYFIPFEELSKYKIPVINLGPWGKDIHKRTERVYLPHIQGQTKDHYLNFLKKLSKLK